MTGLHEEERCLELGRPALIRLRMPWYEPGAPNNAFEPTPLRGVQDRVDLESWFRPRRFPDLWVRHGSMLAVGPPGFTKDGVCEQLLEARKGA